MSILDHVWGESLPADRVWAMVCGLAPKRAGRRLLLALQAYVDDSIGRDGTYVLAGHISTAERWAAFSKEWEEMLPYGTKDKYGDYHFHMVEMAKSEDRMSRVIAFERIIEKHVIGSISLKINIHDVAASIKRVHVQGSKITFNHHRHPLAVAVFNLLSSFNGNRLGFSPGIPIDEPVDFIFDDNSQKALIISAWDKFFEGSTEDQRRLYGATPRFEDDKAFLPLQAADLWAWWVRKRYEEGEQEKLIGGADYERFSEHRKIPKAFIEYSQDQLTNNLIKGIQQIAEPGRRIFDVKSSKAGYSVRFSIPTPQPFSKSFELQVSLGGI